MALRFPLLLLFAAIVVAVLASVGALVGVLNSLLVDEATRNAEQSIRSSLEHAAVLVTAPFSNTVSLVRRAAAEMAERNLTCHTIGNDTDALRPQLEAWLATVNGSSLPMYAVYQTYMTPGGDYHTWSDCGCVVPDKYCAYGSRWGWTQLPFQFPNVSTTRGDTYTAVADWNFTSYDYVQLAMSLTPSDHGGRWGYPEIWNDASTGRAAAYISFAVPVAYDAYGRCVAAEHIDIFANSLVNELKKVSIEDTDLVVVHPAQKTLLATTYANVPVMKVAGGESSLWPMDRTPNAELNAAVDLYRSALQLEASNAQRVRAGSADEQAVVKASELEVRIGSNKIHGFFPLKDGTLRLAVLTITDKAHFFSTLEKARMIGILVGIGCAVLCVIVALVIWFALHRSLVGLQEAMVPAARLQCDPAVFNAQGKSWVSDVAVLQEAFGVMNAKLHEAGAYLPLSVRAAWTEDYTTAEGEGGRSPHDGALVSESETLNGSTPSSVPDPALMSDAGSAPRALAPAAFRDADGALHPTTSSLHRAHHRARIAVLHIGVAGVGQGGGGGNGVHGVVDTAAVCSVVTEIVVRCAGDVRGVVSHFEADHFIVTFNAVTSCAAPNRKAVACAFAVAREIAALSSTSLGGNVMKPSSPTKPLDKSSVFSQSLEESTDTIGALRLPGFSSQKNSEVAARKISSGLDADRAFLEHSVFPDMSVTSGVVSAVAVVGDIGCRHLRRFGVLGPALSQAFVLERLCRSYAHGAPAPVTRRTSSDSVNSQQQRPTVQCLVPGPVAEDIAVHFRTVAVDYVRLPGTPNASLLSAVVGEQENAAGGPTESPAGNRGLNHNGLAKRASGRSSGKSTASGSGNATPEIDAGRSSPVRRLRPAATQLASAEWLYVVKDNTDDRAVKAFAAAADVNGDASRKAEVLASVVGTERPSRPLSPPPAVALSVNRPQSPLARTRDRTSPPSAPTLALDGDGARREANDAALPTLPAEDESASPCPAPAFDDDPPRHTAVRTGGDDKERRQQEAPIVPRSSAGGSPPPVASMPLRTAANLDPLTALALRHIAAVCDTAEARCVGRPLGEFYNLALAPGSLS